MDAHAVEEFLLKQGIPHYWDYITTYDDVIKAYYFDYDTGEEEYDIFRIDGSNIYRKLDYMPFDWNGKHATGWEKWNQVFTGGMWEDQYEEGMI